MAFRKRVEIKYAQLWHELHPSKADRVNKEKVLAAIRRSHKRALIKGFKANPVRLTRTMPARVKLNINRNEWLKPLQDVLKVFDPMGSGYIYSDAFFATMAVLELG